MRQVCFMTSSSVTGRPHRAHWSCFDIADHPNSSAEGNPWMLGAARLEGQDREGGGGNWWR